MTLSIIIPVSIIVVSVLGYYLYQSAKQRREALTAIATTLGFTFKQKADMSTLGAADLHLFHQGRSKRLRNVMQRISDDVQISIYDYSYTTGGGNSSHTHVQTVFQFQCERLSLPGFTLCPEHVFHKIGKTFGYQDIDFDLFSEFSQKYLLRGKDEEGIRKVFNQELVALLEKAEKLSVEAEGHVVICYRSGKRVKPEELFEKLERMREIFQLLIRRCEYL